MKAKTKKMTLAYWNSLPADTRERAIAAAIPNSANTLAKWWRDAKPDLKDHMWQLVFSLVRRPEDGSFYRVVVNGWSMM